MSSVEIVIDGIYFFSDNSQQFDNDTPEPTPLSTLSSFVDSQQRQADCRQSLNTFLSTAGCSPIKKVLTVPWNQASHRTQQDYKNELHKVLTSAAKVLAPKDSDALLSSILQAPESESESKALPAFAAAYNIQERGDIKQQILSIMCDKFSLKELQKYIPELTSYRFKRARHHQLLHGRGVVAPDVTITRQRVTQVQVEHFIEFFTDHHLQDLPLCGKTVKLETGEQYDIPKVILTNIPSTIIDQYMESCVEQKFTHPSPATLRRILDACGTKYRFVPNLQIEQPNDVVILVHVLCLWNYM